MRESGFLIFLVTLHCMHTDMMGICLLLYFRWRGDVRASYLKALESPAHTESFVYGTCKERCIIWTVEKLEEYDGSQRLAV